VFLGRQGDILMEEKKEYIHVEWLDHEGVVRDTLRDRSREVRK
jgi:hypothetical protein